MPGTPIHGLKAESEAAHMHRCENEEGGPVCELKKDLRAMHATIGDMTTSFVALKATLRTWGRAGTLVLSVLTFAVAVLAYVQSTREGRASHVVPQAQAATKGSP